MRLLYGVLLLLLTCQLVTPIPIFDRDGAGFRSEHRSAAFGETVRDWFRMVKNRIVGKWHEWFGDTPTPNFSPQDILNIDKTLEKRIQGYPGLFLDLSDLSFDPNQDWGVRLGNWHIIRKITGDNYGPDSGDSDEWDIKSLIPVLPSPPILTFNWPDIQGYDTPKTTRPATTTPRITTVRQETPRIWIEPTVSTNIIGSTVSTTEPIVTSRESFLPDTQPTVSFTELTVTPTEQTLASDETVVTNTRPSIISSTELASMTTDTIITSEPTVLTTDLTVISNEPVLTSTESTMISTTLNIPLPVLTPNFSEPTVSPTDSIMNSLEPIVTSTESILVSIESTAITTESIIIENETTTESLTISTDITLPVLNKRIEDNETYKKSTKKPNNRRSSAEVIMF